MSCPNCSVTVPPGAATCAGCGVALPATPPLVSAGVPPDQVTAPVPPQWPGWAPPGPQPAPQQPGSGWGPQPAPQQPGAGWGPPPGGGWTAQPGVPPTGWYPAWAPPPVEVPSGLATAAAGLLALCGALHVVAVGVGATYSHGLSALLDGTAGPSDVRGVENAYIGIGVVQAVALLATGIVFLFWFSRVDGVVRELGVADLRHSHGWAVGAWFVPFLNLVRPKQMVDDAWRGADPALPPGGWMQATVPAPRWLSAWWALWIASSLIGWRSAMGGTGLEDLRTGADIGMLADLLSAAAAALAVLLVLRLTARVRARAANLGRLRS